MHYSRAVKDILESFRTCMSGNKKIFAVLLFMFRQG